MSKLKARLDQAVANDLGIELSSESITLKEVAAKPNIVDTLVFAFIEGDYVCYDTVPVWRCINKGVHTQQGRGDERCSSSSRRQQQLHDLHGASDLMSADSCESECLPHHCHCAAHSTYKNLVTP